MDIKCGSCSHKYTITDQDFEWKTYNTYCPKCKSSLTIQLLDKAEILKDGLDITRAKQRIYGYS